MLSSNCKICYNPKNVGKWKNRRIKIILFNTLQVILRISYGWSSNGRDMKGIKWLSWNKLSKPKQFGCLSLRNLCALNIAILGKQASKFIMYLDAMLSKNVQGQVFSLVWFSWKNNWSQYGGIC